MHKVDTKRVDGWQTTRTPANSLLQDETVIQPDSQLWSADPATARKHRLGDPTVYEAPAIIGSCINCIAPGSLAATLALILIGAGIALVAERRKPIRTQR